MVRILVASATANTASNTIRYLSEAKDVEILALVRKIDARSNELAALPNVKVVEGDFDNEASIEAALKGVNRAMLVTQSGQHEQFDRETTFIDLAMKAGVEGIVRISTCTVLIHPGSTGVYARAHACIKSFIAKHNAPVVEINPNLFMSNVLGSAGEAKEHGTISQPTPGTGKLNMVDARDVGSAAAHILLLPSEQFAKFVAQREIEVHGPHPVSYQDLVAAVSKNVGYTITYNPITFDQFAGALQSAGLSKLFARSYAHTVTKCDGTEPGDGEFVNTTSELLLASGWKPKYDLDAFASSDFVVAAFRK